MNRLTAAVSALALTAGGAMAGGLDRSGQGIGIIFEEGNYGQLSFASTTPSLDGDDLLTTGTTGNVGDAFVSLGAGVKFQITDQTSVAFIFEEPFGADISYPVNATSLLLGGTSAQADTTSMTAVLRYEINENFSVHGGVRNQTAEGNITLGGLAYGGVNGYSVDLSTNNAWGYLVGVAYERPDIALRVALTYNSAITHDFATLETLGGAPIGAGTTEVETPQSINLDFQTGIAKDTLLFGSIRWAEWSAFEVNPTTFAALTGGGLVDLEDTMTYTLGVGRRFNEKLSGSVSITYEAASDDDLVSPLAPSNGLTALAIGGRYQASDSTVISGGVRYTMIGDAFAETGTPDTPRADFTGNSALSVGMSIGFNF